MILRSRIRIVGSLPELEYVICSSASCVQCHMQEVHSHESKLNLIIVPERLSDTSLWVRIQSQPPSAQVDWHVRSFALHIRYSIARAPPVMRVIPYKIYDYTCIASIAPPGRRAYPASAYVAYQGARVCVVGRSPRRRATATPRYTCRRVHE